MVPFTSNNASKYAQQRDNIADTFAWTQLCGFLFRFVVYRTKIISNLLSRSIDYEMSILCTLNHKISRHYLLKVSRSLMSPPITPKIDQVHPHWTVIIWITAIYPTSIKNKSFSWQWISFMVWWLWWYSKVKGWSLCRPCWSGTN